MLEVFPIMVIGAVSGFLAYHEDYDDGFVGRSALGLVVLMSVIIVLGVAQGFYSYELPLEIFLLLCGVAVFSVRHALRFLQYHRNKKYTLDAVDRRGRA